jgi:hypothetical protein
MPTQPRFFEPARNGTLEHSWAGWTQTLTGDDEHAAPPGIERAADERRKRLMRFRLGFSVQIEPRLDGMKTAFEALGVCPVDPGEMAEGRGPNLRSCTLFNGRRRRL